MQASDRVLPRIRQVGIASISGAVAGVLVAGIGGRIAMRVVALVEGAAPGFTIGGTLFAIFALGLLAMPFALLYVLTAQHLSERKWRALVLGGSYFLLLIALSLLRRSGSGLGELEVSPLVGGALFTGVLALNGLAVHVLAGRLERTMPPVRRTIPSALGYGILSMLAGFGVFSVVAFVLGT